MNTGSIMSNVVLLLGRILASAIFIQAGYSEMMNLAGTIGYFESLGLRYASLLVWPVLALELGGGLLILVGFMTRPVALLLGIFAVAAAVVGHFDFGNFTEFQMFMKDMAIAGGYLFISVTGAGTLSVDAALKAQAG